MGKFLKMILATALSIFMCVSASADILEGKNEPDVKTDYYMIVESPDGGIDMYAQPDMESAKLNEEQIPNGTALHIYGETEDADGKRNWGYTDYKDMNGYVPLDDCRPADSRQEAIDSELYLAGRDNVDYNADYDVTASSDSGTQSLYQGPGKKYEAVPGARDIKNGETLHITEGADMPDGSHWGKTSVDDKEGWVDLEQTEEWKKDHPEDTVASLTAAPGETAAPTQKPTAAPVSEPTATPASTVTPDATATSEPTATPVPTDTSEPTETPIQTATPAPTDTSASTAAPEPAETGAASEKDGEAAARETSSDASKTAASKWYASPFAWITGAAVVAVIGLLIYHYKKR